MFNFSNLQNAWQSANAPERRELPDGDYQVRLEKAQIKESRSGEPYLAYELRIISGQYANQILFKNQRLAQEGLPYLKADLELLQICPNNIGQFRRKVTICPGCRIRCSAKDRGEKGRNADQKRLLQSANQTRAHDKPSRHTRRIYRSHGRRFALGKFVIDCEFETLRCIS